MVFEYLNSGPFATATTKENRIHKNIIGML